MKIKSLATLVAVATLVVACDKAPTESSTDIEAAVDSVELTTREQKLSYIFGQNIGGQLKTDAIDIDVTVFAQGVGDALGNVESKLSEEEIMTVLKEFQEEKMAEQQQTVELQANKNQAEGEAFLTQNGSVDGVVTLESGLQYKVVSEGEGATPGADSTVEVNYRGTLLDGTEFDSSYKRGVPATFGVTQVIPGWTEALMLMKEGAKWELYIPPSLAYGPGGAGGTIGPEATLIFEVELLKANVEPE